MEKEIKRQEKPPTHLVQVARIVLLIYIFKDENISGWSGRLLLNLNCDHFYIFGKTAKPRLDFFNLLRTWRGDATGIVCELLLVDACDCLQGREREYSTVIIKQCCHIEIIYHFIFPVKNGRIASAIFFSSLDVEVDAFLHIILEPVNAACIGTTQPGIKSQAQQ